MSIDKAPGAMPKRWRPVSLGPETAFSHAQTSLLTIFFLTLGGGFGRNEHTVSVGFRLSSSNISVFFSEMIQPSLQNAV
jgi:hypothetical protein